MDRVRASEIDKYILEEKRKKEPLKTFLKRSLKEDLKTNFYVAVFAMLAIVGSHFGCQAYDYYFKEHQEIKRIRQLFEPEIRIEWKPCEGAEGYCGSGQIGFGSSTDVIRYAMIGERRELEAVYLVHTGYANTEAFLQAHKKYQEYVSKLFSDVIYASIPKEIQKGLSFTREDWFFFLLYLQAKG
ncbi:MAG: hypothetical protein N3A54_04865, partial [Patescibacteria group bacterium]|nr:hypothetical protein [Patescibacteria group bacterium]